MYSIEYYKRGKNKPDWLREKKHKNDFENIQDYKDYLRDIKMFYACRKIKSLTIDVNDLDILRATHNPYCEYSCDSYELGVICDCAESLSAKRIVIENNSYTNQELIYNIINTKWLINKDSFEYTDDYDEEEAIKEIIGEMHEVLTKIDTSGYQTKWYYFLSDYLKQLKHYCYESEKINRGEIEEVHEKPKRIGQKQVNRFFDRYDY